MATAEAAKIYFSIVERRADPRAVAWLKEPLEAIAQRFDAEALAALYARAGRRFGHDAIALDAAEKAACAGAGAPAPEGWPLDQATRAALLLALDGWAPRNRYVAVVESLFYRGDNAERQALLKTLTMLPEPGRFVDVAIEACRTNVVSVFEAIACENAYPRTHFPELHFNQMVMKALFLGVAVARIEGLDARMNPELVRMAGDYAAERRAAGRAVPEDIARIAPEAFQGAS